MMENLPVSVLMSVFNAEKYIREAIDSILNQSFTDFEFIIINDGSTDSSRDIVKSYTDSRIKLFDNEKNLKVAHTCNRSLSLAKGKYLVRMDADDIAMPERIAIQFDFMEKHPDIGLCGSWYENFGEIEGISKYETDHDKIRFLMLFRNPVLHPSSIIRKEIVDQNHLLYDPEFIAGEDHDFLVRLAEVTKVANIPQVLMKYRQHSVSTKGRLDNIMNNFLYKASYNQFRKMGVEITRQDFELLPGFCYSEFQFTFEEFDYLENFLCKIITANSHSNYLKQESLSGIIGEKWFHLCYNISGAIGKKAYKKYKDSSIRPYYNPGKLINAKFFLKNTLKN